MGHFKTFMLGVAVAFGVYYITRKREDGTSMLDEILEHPSEFVDKAKDYAIDQAIRTLKQKIL